MSERAPVLVLGNDLSLASAKSSRHLCLALERLGLRAIGRDTRLIRWAAAEVEKESAVRREAYESGVVAKWNKFIFDYGFDTVISVDLDWLFSSQLFLADGQVRQIHSFWLGEVREQLRATSRFSLGALSLGDLLKNPKISHHCCGGQAEELRALGIERVFSSVADVPEGMAEEHLWEHRLKEAFA